MCCFPLIGELFIIAILKFCFRKLATRSCIIMTSYSHSGTATKICHQIISNQYIVIQLTSQSIQLLFIHSALQLIYFYFTCRQDAQGYELDSSICGPIASGNSIVFRASNYRSLVSQLYCDAIIVGQKSRKHASIWSRVVCKRQLLF